MPIRSITSEFESVLGDIPEGLQFPDLMEVVTLNKIEEVSKGRSRSVMASAATLPRRMRQIIRLAGTVLADESDVSVNLTYKREKEMYKYSFVLRWLVDNPRAIARLSLTPLIDAAPILRTVLYEGVLINSYDSKGRVIYGFSNSKEDSFVREAGERGRLLMALGFEKDSNSLSYQLGLIQELTGLFAHL